MCIKPHILLKHYLHLALSANIVPFTLINYSASVSPVKLFFKSLIRTHCGAENKTKSFFYFQLTHRKGTFLGQTDLYQKLLNTFSLTKHLFRSKESTSKTLWPPLYFTVGMVLLFFHQITRWSSTRFEDILVQSGWCFFCKRRVLFCNQSA